MNTGKNIKIEIVKPLVFKIHYKATKERFEVINYITIGIVNVQSKLKQMMNVSILNS